jgi:sugar/nucleoside kinase (ribokinase family)
MTHEAPSSVLLGRLARQTLINAQGQVFIDQPGGGLLYAAASAGLWGIFPGLLARVGVDYPLEWVKKFAQLSFDTRGIRTVNEPVDERLFIAYRDVDTPSSEQPIRHFARLGMALPKTLLDYQTQPANLDPRRQRSSLTLRPEDLPEAFHGTRVVHLCDLDFLSHSLIPAALRQAGVKTITLDAGRGYMAHDFLEEIPGLLNGLTAFLVEEKQLRDLFGGRYVDLWQMAEQLASYNCPVILIKRTKGGQLLLDAEMDRRYQIPPYPAMPKDITGQSSSFSGAFHAGLVQSKDFLHAALMGNVTASLAAAGSGPFYVLGSLSGLAESRLASLATAVKVV